MYLFTSILKSWHFRDQQNIFVDGPSEDGVSLYAQPTTETEGRKWTWVCYGGFSNPPLNFTWYNGTTEFTPDTPPIIELNVRPLIVIIDKYVRLLIVIIEKM